MRDRRQFLGLSAGALLAGVLPLFACAPARPLACALNPWPGYAFLAVANRRQRLDARAIRIAETASVALSSQLLESGEVDAAAITLDEALRLSQSGLDLTVVLVFNTSVGADALLARSEITTLAALKGKRIGMEHGATGELMLTQALKRAGLTRQDVTATPIEGDHLLAWNTLQLDAIVTYEPALTKLEALGARRLFDSRHLPDTILDVLAVRTTALAAHAAQVRALVAAHFEELTRWKKNPIGYVFELAEVLAVPAEDVRQVVSGLTLPDLPYNRHLLAHQGGELKTTLDALASFMTQPGAHSTGTANILKLTDAYLPGDRR